MEQVRVPRAASLRLFSDLTSLRSDLVNTRHVWFIVESLWSEARCSQYVTLSLVR